MVKIANSLEELLGLVKSGDNTNDIQPAIDISNKSTNPCPEPSWILRISPDVQTQLNLIQIYGTKLISSTGGFIFFLFGKENVIDKLMIPEQQFIENIRFLRIYEINKLLESIKKNDSIDNFYGWGIFTNSNIDLSETEFDDYHSRLIESSKWLNKEGSHQFIQMCFIHILKGSVQADHMGSFGNNPFISSFLLSQYPCGTIHIKNIEPNIESESENADFLKQHVLESLKNKIRISLKEEKDRNIKYKIDTSLPIKLNLFLNKHGEVIKKKTKLEKHHVKLMIAVYIKFIFEKKSKKLELSEKTTTGHSKGGESNFYI